MNSVVNKYNNEGAVGGGGGGEGGTSNNCSKFVNELTSLPLVKSASACANKACVKLKNSNVVLSYIFNLVDLLMFVLYSAWSKVASQLGKQIAYLDAFAYDLLIRVEKRFPILTKETSVIVDTIVRRYPQLDKLNQKYEAFKLNALQTLQTKSQLTKNKIEVYKAYLDVMSKQFLVQDGRSLDHVHVRAAVGVLRAN
jgi:hypothetical protein